MRKLLLLAVPLLLLASCATEEQPAVKNPAPDASEVVTLPNGVKLEVIEGMYIYQGDIILTQEQVDILGSEQTRGYVVDSYVKTWPNGTIYYTVNSQIPAASLTLLTQAIEHWEANTNIRLVVRTNQPDYVEFNATQSFIPSSNVGRVTGKQYVNFWTNSTLGDVLALIGHTVGLMNEHARSDRDQYINIVSGNIIPGFEALYFGTDPSGITYREFDFNSVMLWNSYKYTMTGMPTITDKNGNAYIANDTHLSEGDIAAVKFLYGEYSEDLLLKLNTSSPFPIGTTAGISASYYSLTCTSPAYKYEVIDASTGTLVYTSAITTGGINYTFQNAGTFNIRVTVTNETPQKTAETTVVVQSSVQLQIQISGSSVINAADHRTISAVYSPANPNATFLYEISGGHGNTTFTGKTAIYSFCLPGIYTIKATPTNVIPATPVQTTVTVDPFQGFLYEVVTEQLMYDTGTEQVYSNTLTMATSGNPMEAMILHCMPYEYKVTMGHYMMKTSKMSGAIIENVNIGPVTFTMPAGGSISAQLPQTYTMDRGSYIETTYLLYTIWIDP